MRREAASERTTLSSIGNPAAPRAAIARRLEAPEWLENGLHLSFRYARPVILDPDQGFPPFFEHDERAAPILHGIVDQIREGAFQRHLAADKPGLRRPAIGQGRARIGGRINVALIRVHWSEILRVVASIRTGTVTASLIMRQLASHPRQNGVAAAIRELGRLERTLFTLDWIDDPELRRTTGQELNKGEARNSLARAVFIHRLGEIRDRTNENQQHRASGLNLLVTAIILWNTRYLESAVATLHQFEDVPDQLLAHLSPLGWEHVNLTGDYVWGSQQIPSENIVGLRPLRSIPEMTKKAA